MKYWKILIRKNSSIVKIALLLFFGIAYFFNIVARYYWGKLLHNPLHFQWIDAEMIVMIGLIILNPKGIKILVSAVLLFLVVVSTYFELFIPMSGINITLIYRDFFSIFHLRLNFGLIYLFHMLMYCGFIILIFKTQKSGDKQLLDQ